MNLDIYDGNIECWTLIRDRSFEGNSIELKFKVTNEGIDTPIAELIERRFRAYFIIKRLQLIRITLPCLFAGFLLLGLSYDVVFVGDSNVLFHYRILKYGCQLPIIVFYFGVTFTTFYCDYTQPINMVLALALGGFNIAVSVIGGQPDHGPQMLYFFIVYMFLNLRFLYATFVSWCLYFTFIIAVRYSTNASKLGLSTGYMTLSNSALMFACYFTEYWLRLDFSRHNLLKIEEQKANDLLSTLLPDRITAQLRELDGDNHLIAEEFNDVSILFSDIVGFTAYSANSKRSSDFFEYTLHYA